MEVFVAIGGAVGVWDELKEALDLIPADAAVTFGAVNESGAAFSGPLSLWATLHAEKFEKWQRLREVRGYNVNYTAICHKRFPQTRVDRIEPELWNGTSGLYLVQAALKTFGFNRVIVCGMPIDNRPNEYRKGKAWNDSNVYKRGWERKACGDPCFIPSVRSMSGWTQQLLGAPTRKWLAMPA